VTVGKGPLLGFVERFAGELRFPQLFLLTAILFVLDVLIPDLIPFADEILLGLVTLLLANWKRRPRPAEERAPAGRPDAPVIDVTPVAADDPERDGHLDG
jgi:hypothetical protein